MDKVKMIIETFLNQFKSLSPRRPIYPRDVPTEEADEILLTGVLLLLLSSLLSAAL